MTFPRDSFRWRKSTDVDREYSLFELLTNEVLLLDVGFSDEGVFEIAFHEQASGWMIDWDHFEAIIDEGRCLAQADQS